MVHGVKTDNMHFEETAAGLTSEEEGLIDVVELGKDWQLPITEEMLAEYERLIEKRRRLEEGKN